MGTVSLGLHTHTGKIFKEQDKGEGLVMKITLVILFLFSFEQLSLGTLADEENGEMDLDNMSYQDKLEMLENMDSMMSNAYAKRNPFIRRQEFIDSIKRSPFMQRQNFMRESKRSPFMQRQDFMEDKRSPFMQRQSFMENKRSPFAQRLNFMGY